MKGLLSLFCLALVTFQPGTLAAAPTLLGTAAQQFITSSTLTSYTVAAGTDRLLVVTAGDPGTPTNPSSVTFNGTSMSLGNSTSDGQYSCDSIWYLKLGTGAAVTGNIVVSFGGTASRYIGAAAYSGVDQTTPVDANGPKISGSHTGIPNKSSSLTVITGQTGDLVFDLLDSYHNTNVPGNNQGGGQTVVNNVGAIWSAGASRYTTSTKAGAPSVAMDWTTTNNGGGSTSIAILHLTMNINGNGGSVVAPTVTTAAQSAVAATSATLGGNVTADGGASVTERGIVWGTAAAPTTANNKVANGSGTGTFSATVTGLPAGTLVYVRAYAINSVNTSYGNEISFTTPAGVAEIGVTEPGVGNVADNSAFSFGTTTVGTPVTKTFTVANTGTAVLTLSNLTVPTGFTVAQTFGTTSVPITTGTTTFQITMSATAAGSPSGVLSFDNNDVSESPYNFTLSGTVNGVAPTVTTAAQSAVTATSATLGGNVTSDGGTSVTERGIVWGTATAPTTANNKVANGSGTGAFSATVSGLPAATLVYVRAYATNSVNTSYGNEISFTTLSNNANLSGLVLTTATINETFAANTTSYTSSVPNTTTSVTVTANRAQANATIEARVGANAFAPVTSGTPSSSLALAVGANTIEVRVTAQDGTTTKTYAITVTRAAADYAITTGAGVLTITDNSGNADSLSAFESSVGTISFGATGRTFSLNGAASSSNFSSNISLTGITSVVVNAAAGADSISLSTFTTVGGFPSLTINGGTGDDTVNINGDITFASGAGLDIDMQNDDASPGADSVILFNNSNYVLSGAGTVVIKCSKGIRLITGASIITASGGITLHANQQATRTSGDFDGISLSGATVESASGPVELLGKAGQAAVSNTDGVLLSSSSTVRGQTTTLVGTGSNVSGGFNNGVSMAASLVSSFGGAVSVTGNGGNGGAGPANFGVVVYSGTISSGGTGTVTVNGTGGAGTGSQNYGVDVQGTITSVGGNVSVTGTGGSGSSNQIGINMTTSGGLISAGGAGTVTVLGTGGSAADTANHIGINVVGCSITSNSGNVSITGNGGGTGSASSSYGVFVAHGSTLSPGGSGTLTVDGTGGPGTGASNDGIRMEASVATAGTITSGGGNISINGTQGTNTGLGLELGSSGGH